MFLIVQINPDFFARDPFLVLFRASSQAYRNHRLQIFSEMSAVEKFIFYQQRIIKNHFILLSFENSLERQIQALRQNQINEFFTSLTEMRYFSPFSRPINVDYDIRRSRISNQHRHFIDEQSRFTPTSRPAMLRTAHFSSPIPRPTYSRPSESSNVHDSSFDADHDFTAAQEASLQDYAARSTPKPFNPAIFAESEIPLKETLPNDFKLSDNLTEDLRNNKLSDPISLEEINLDEVSRLACIRLDNGFYNLYEPKAIYEQYKATTEDGNHFKDIFTNSKVNISDVFTISPELLKDFVNISSPRP